MRSTILAIDDDQDILESLQLALEMEGYVVVTASQEANLKELVEQALPDVVLLDYLLSGTTGVEIATKLRALKVTVPIILITAHPKVNVEQQGALINDVLPKPFSIDALVKMVEKHLVGRAGKEGN